MELFQLVRREEHLHQTAAPAADQGKDGHAAQHGTEQAQGRARPGAEGVAPGDLQRLAGDNGHQHLQKHHGHIGQRPPGTVAVYPGAELFRLAGKADDGPAHEPGQRRRQQNEYDDGQYGQRFFLLFGQRALHGRHLFLLYYPQDTTIFGKSCERNVKICL